MAEGWKLAAPSCRGQRWAGEVSEPGSESSPADRPARPCSLPAERFVSLVCWGMW